ncbi:cell envelope integrity protein TolA [Acinetobacter rudis]|uniref:cell envelope integrity protein TolA n=1 Tax=Acinetobacter rudis TaxID=632955 RepID=UPI00333EAC7F
MNAQAQITHSAAPVGLLNLESFELSQRIGKMLSSSTLVPEQYRATTKVKAGKDNFGNWIYKDEPNPNGLANCVIALNMANRMGADPLMVMQNLYLIEGRPAWSSQFIMASINNSGRFSALRFDIVDLGEKEVEYSTTEWSNGRKNTVVKTIKIHDISCVAHAIERETGERIESSKITIEMAVKEGWFTKNGSKWQTMPEQMLRYRAASFFGRVYAPELLMGLRSADEEQDRIIDVTPAAEQAATATSANQFDFKQLKRDILTAKSPDQLQKLEIFIEEHSNEDEQKELVKLMQAQINKLTAVAEEPAAKKPEPQIEATSTAAAVEEKPKVESKKARTPAAKKEVVKDDSKYQSLLKDLIDIVSKANSIPEAKAQLRYADNNNWTDQQRKPLIDAIDKRVDELNKMDLNGTALSNTCQLPETEKPLLEQIQEAPSIEVLDELLKQARRFTGEKGHIHMTAWSARKEFLNQGDIFENLDAEQHEDNLTLCGQIVKSIQACQTQEEINKIFEDPKLSELIPEEQALVNAAADRREAEITG